MASTGKGVGWEKSEKRKLAVGVNQKSTGLDISSVLQQVALQPKHTDIRSRPAKSHLLAFETESQ